ncbi:MAG: UDP-N-acetylglucosamine 2-epimerase (non-hydrolyzing), partial [Bdellovibrionales bacterium]|nr:UDP-N-acetylglucosamine 2-epimerase (non-hydrolyzing) [Bdellovibrionales bacterium]
ARPQFIKAAVVSKAIRENRKAQEIMIHTGQHYDHKMSNLFFEELEIAPPQYNLEVGSGGHGAQTGRMLEKIEAVLMQENPDVVIIYGDTNSTKAGALAAAKLHIPLAHIEAGLRSFNKKMPEEVNRVLSDHCSDWLFAPTGVAVKNLIAEGIDKAKIFEVGDVMYDVTRHFSQKAKEKSNILTQLDLSPKNYILSTIHRAENTNDKSRLTNLFTALGMLSEEIQVILPLHPRTQNLLTSELKQLANKVNIIEPVGYLDMLMLENNAKLIATDSGGVQKEAFFSRVPCVTLRDETEWVELIDLGWNTLVSTQLDGIELKAKISSRLGVNGKESQPYGDGHSANKICEILNI